MRRWRVAGNDFLEGALGQGRHAGRKAMIDPLLTICLVKQAKRRIAGRSRTILCPAGYTAAADLAIT